MAKPSEVKTTAEEIAILLVEIGIKNWTPEQFTAADKAIAKLIAKRVPDKKEVVFVTEYNTPVTIGGEWNACVDAMLKGNCDDDDEEQG